MSLYHRHTFVEQLSHRVVVCQRHYHTLFQSSFVFCALNCRWEAQSRVSYPQSQKSTITLCYYVFRAWDRCIWSLCPILYRGWDNFSALLTGLSEGNRGQSINYTLDKSLSGKCFPNSLLTSTYHEYFSVERGDAKDNCVALQRALGTQLRFSQDLCY